ncbi:CARDB domain-containing protein [Methanolobus sp. WCC4]|uniref:CARDB domain-containing protein n=1 Tax=Methanolobus sp. WCC4 TaxID=3125784 RepID=UPI0030FD1C8D
MLFSTSAAAYDLDDIEWSDDKSTSATLHWGGTVTLDDYTIKAEDFDEGGFVSIGIYRNGVLEDKSPVQSGTGFEFRDTENGDDIRIFVKSMDLNIDEWTGNMEDPTASIEVYERGIPEMDITVETEKDEYDPRTVAYQYIEATIDITNDGDAKAYDMDVDIDVDGMELADGKLTYNYVSVEEDEVLDTIDIKLEIPHYWEETDVEINVTTSSEDINGEILEDTETKTITIEPVVELIITKTVTEEIYMDETAHVSVSIWNNGIYSVGSVKVANTVTDDLEIQDSLDDEITLSFSPKETKAKIFEYTLKPIKTGEYTVPEATATFTAPDGETYTFTADKPSIQINGPDIVLTKTVNPGTIYPGNESTVTVTVKNQGNRDASVHTTEIIPDGVAFISGDLSFDDVAVNGKSYSYSYKIMINDIGELKLSETSATFIDMENYKGEKISNSPIITVLDPNPETVDSSAGSSSDSSSTSNEQESSSSDSSTNYEDEYEDTRVQPGFEASLMIVALFAVYLVSRRSR